MEAGSPRYLLYGLLILGSWLVSCSLHFQFIHMYLLSSQPRSGAALVDLPLPMAVDASFPPAPSAVGADEDGHSSTPSSVASSSAAAACEGRYVYMLDVPSRFDVLSGCVEGAPAFEDEYSMCSLMVNAGMGPVLPPATGNGSDGDTGVIPNTGW
jgi:hypothetical protein